MISVTDSPAFGISWHSSHHCVTVATSLLIEAPPTPHFRGVGGALCPFVGWIADGHMKGSVLPDQVLQFRKGLVKLLFFVVRPKDGAIFPVEYELPARSDVRMHVVKPHHNLCRIDYVFLKNKYAPAFLFGLGPIHAEVNIMRMSSFAAYCHLSAHIIWQKSKA